MINIEKTILCNANRDLIIPDDVRYQLDNLVREEHRTRTIKCAIPKVWDNISDISALDIFVNVQSKKSSDVYQVKAENVASDTYNDVSYCTFDWVITDDLTHRVGDYWFLICASQVSTTTGKVTVHWNSKPCDQYGTVLDGPEPDHEVVVNPSITETLVSEITSIKNDIATIKQALGIGGS